VKLLLDVGNSRIKWAVLADGALTQMGADFYRAQPMAAMFSRHFARLAPPAAVIIASVADTACNEALAQQIQSHWRLNPRFLHTQPAQAGVTNGYHHPERLGVDRWLAMIAAHARVTAPCLVISAGTAVTVDALDSSGQHLGGLILPGLYLMASSLAVNTAGVPQAPDDLSTAGEFFGRDTGEGVIKGTQTAIVECITRSARELAQRYGKRIECLITGGDGPIVQAALSMDCEYQPHLVLQGIATILELD